jgi:anaerobic magnesium-protoporphyrin IX monomethyl ester cyclase
VCPTWTEDLGRFAKLAKKRNSQPPLGILYLAAIAERKGHKARVIDADVENFTMETLVDEIVSQRYDLVGITATSPIFHKAVALAGQIKAKGVKAPLLIGGEHVNIFKEKAFLDPFDFAFYGESDHSFHDFLDRYEKGAGDYEKIAGLIFRKNGTTIVNAPRERIADLDELTFPSMHLLKRNVYIMTFARLKKREYLPIMATRGCPFKCVFCSEPLTNPQVRYRSAKNIVDEMELWNNKLRISHFFFMDSNITLNRKQIEAVCNEILKRNLKVTWEGWTRANLVDRDVLKLMKKAGLVRISYGIESGDPRVLKIIRKEVALEDMLNAFKITEEIGIESACSVMLGLPGDTRESVMKTINFVKSIPQVRYSNFSIANPYPGTEMYSWALEGKHGMRFLIKDFSEYKRYDDSPVAVNDLTKDDLIRLQKIGLLKIHLTPKRILAAIRMVGFWQLFPLFLVFLDAAVKNVFKSRRIQQA